MRFIAGVIGLIVFFGSCKKLEESPSSHDSYKFYVRGEVEGRSLDLKAGEGDYYMFTNTETEEGQAQWFTGKLAEANCSNACAEQLTIRFKGKDSEPIEAIVNDKRVDFTIHEPKLKYGVQFTTEKTFTSRANEVVYHWEVDNETSLEEKDPYVVLAADKEFYDVRLEVKTSKGVDSKIENRIYTDPNCKTWFEYKKQDGKNRLIAKHKGAAVVQYFWEFEDGSSASVPILDFESSSIKGSERVCLTITDENGCVSQSCQNVLVNERFAFCAANYDYELEEILPKNGFEQFHTVELEYTDPSGETYYSNRLEQGQSLVVLNVEDYPELNENGQKVKRIQFAVSCQLVSLSGKTIQLNNLEGKLGVAVP
jgi:hypothetical protein